MLQEWDGSCEGNSNNSFDILSNTEVNNDSDQEDKESWQGSVESDCPNFPLVTKVKPTTKVSFDGSAMQKFETPLESVPLAYSSFA